MECLKSTIVHRLILTTILSAASISIAAQEHQFHQKVTGLKDTSCTSANESANGFYQRICGVEEEGNYAVIDGVAFTYEKAQPNGAFRQTSDTNGYVPSGDLVETLAAYRACEA
jgi:hypothetical protein